MTWFRKKPTPTPTFRERVDEFWTWWSARHDRLLKAVGAEGGASIQAEVSEAVNRLGSGYGWVFGPPPDDVEGHSFTLSPEGCTTKRYLTRYWLAHAPELPGWTFHAARQPSAGIAGAAIRIGDVEVSCASLWITPSIDAENEEIDITAWSPAFGEIERDQAMQILFLLLDECLGEDATERCIGTIDLGDGKLDRSIPIAELNQFVLDTFAEREWRILDRPWSIYRIEEPSGNSPRSDIFVGTTENYPLVREWMRAEGPIDSPVDGSGADLVFVQLPRTLFPEGDELDFRHAIADDLDAALQPELGRVTGGAMGNHAGYLDLILFDGERSREAVAEVMRSRDLLDHYQLVSFVK